jgi:hypothetical protein
VELAQGARLVALWVFCATTMCSLLWLVLVLARLDTLHLLAVLVRTSLVLA